jgi:hypothetical protein
MVLLLKGGSELLQDGHPESKVCAIRERVLATSDVL